MWSHRTDFPRCGYWNRTKWMSLLIVLAFFEGSRESIWWGHRIHCELPVARSDFSRDKAYMTALPFCFVTVFPGIMQCLRSECFAYAFFFSSRAPGRSSTSSQVNNLGFEYFVEERIISVITSSLTSSIRTTPISSFAISGGSIERGLFQIS